MGIPDGTRKRLALRSRRAARLLAAIVACALLAGLFAGGASAAWRPYKPPPGKNFFGVTDTGSDNGFRSFGKAVGHHPAIIETYHPYGNSLTKSLPRWQSVRARPLLHISTVDENGSELISPRGIALGKADDYLLRLNRSFATHHVIGYIRPLGEPNRCLNVYAAYDCSGASRGERYSPKWYRRAFRRMYILLHGGGKRPKINRKLKNIGLPIMKRHGGREPRRLPRAPIAVIWSPLPGGSPSTAANRPGNFFPGPKYVDWVATDFYSKYPYWRELARFYNRYAKGFDKPFALTEFGLWGGDSPKFVRKLFTFVRKHRHARMLVYYQDFGTSNEFRIQNYPSSMKVLANFLGGPRYPGLAPNAPRRRKATGGVNR